MIHIVALRLLLDAAFCIGLMVAGRAINQKETRISEPQTTQVVNGQGMMQQVSVTLQVNPQQVSMAGFSGLLNYSRRLISQSASLLKRGLPLILVGATSASYLFLRRISIHGNNYLRATNSWWAWLEGHDDFFSLTGEEKIKELLDEIHLRYNSQTTASNFFDQCNLFIIEINAEINCVNRYLSWSYWLSRVHAEKFLPYNHDNWEQFEQIKNALQELKTTFLQWFAEYKIAVHKGKDLLELESETDCMLSLDLWQKGVCI
jgi:hypothetical protein